MKRIPFLLLICISLISCEKDPPPPTGDLLITVEYDGFGEENVEVWLFDSWASFESIEYLDKQLSDENGEVFWEGLSPGQYIIEAEITKPVDFHLYAVDSVDVVENIRKNKRIILQKD